MSWARCVLRSRRAMTPEVEAGGREPAERLVEVQDRRLVFELEAHDGVDSYDEPP